MNKKILQKNLAFANNVENKSITTNLHNEHESVTQINKGNNKLLDNKLTAARPKKIAANMSEFKAITATEDYILRLPELKENDIYENAVPYLPELNINDTSNSVVLNVNEIKTNAASKHVTAKVAAPNVSQLEPINVAPKVSKLEPTNAALNVTRLEPKDVASNVSKLQPKNVASNVSELQPTNVVPNVSKWAPNAAAFMANVTRIDVTSNVPKFKANVIYKNAYPKVSEFKVNVTTENSASNKLQFMAKNIPQVSPNVSKLKTSFSAEEVTNVMSKNIIPYVSVLKANATPKEVTLNKPKLNVNITPQCVTPNASTFKANVRPTDASQNVAATKNDGSHISVLKSNNTNTKEVSKIEKFSANALPKDIAPSEFEANASTTARKLKKNATCIDVTTNMRKFKANVTPKDFTPKNVSPNTRKSNPNLTPKVVAANLTELKSTDLTKNSFLSEFEAYVTAKNHLLNMPKYKARKVSKSKCIFTREEIDNAVCKEQLPYISKIKSNIIPKDITEADDSYLSELMSCGKDKTLVSNISEFKSNITPKISTPNMPKFKKNITTKGTPNMPKFNEKVTTKNIGPKISNDNEEIKLKDDFYGPLKRRKLIFDEDESEDDEIVVVEPISKLPHLDSTLMQVRSLIVNKKLEESISVNKSLQMVKDRTVPKSYGANDKQKVIDADSNIDGIILNSNVKLDSSTPKSEVKLGKKYTESQAFIKDIISYVQCVTKHNAYWLELQKKGKFYLSKMNFLLNELNSLKFDSILQSESIKIKEFPQKVSIILKMVDEFLAKRDKICKKLFEIELSMDYIMKYELVDDPIIYDNLRVSTFWNNVKNLANIYTFNMETIDETLIKLKARICDGLSKQNV